MALDKLWTEAQSKVETKVADTKFLVLRDVLAKEGNDFQRYSIAVTACLMFVICVIKDTKSNLGLNDVSYNQLEP